MSRNWTLYRKVLLSGLLLVLSMFLLRFASGAFSIVLLLLGIGWAFAGSYGKSLACYAFFPFLFITNPFIVPKAPLMITLLKVGPMLIGLTLLLMSSRRQGRHRLPLGGLFIYLFFAALSSVGGWCPRVSFLKLINYILFLLGIWLGTQNLQDRPKDVESIRYFFLALICVVVFGSLATLPFPAIAYPLDLNMAKVFYESGLDAATDYFVGKEEGMTLFAGVTFHSQTLAPILSCAFAYVLADMLFVERRMTALHLTLLIMMPVMLFMTRSRTGLLSFVVGVGMVLGYAARKIKLNTQVRAHVQKMVWMGGGMLVLALVVAQLTTGALTRWIRKTDDVKGDSRKLTTAITETRMGLFEESLREFKMNPLFGMGFQVNFESQVLYGNKPGLLLSAPIEKGLLPMMILGEGGIVGGLAFIAFLASFYSGCGKRRYYVSIAMYTTYLATNFGEATFFSPSGAGGIEQVFCILGGFMMDTLLIYRKKLENAVFIPRPLFQMDEGKNMRLG